MTPLRCPYCGEALFITMKTVGRPYMSYEVPDSIDCDSLDCGAAWEPDGTPRTPPR